MKEYTTDLSIKISSHSVEFRQIYGLLKNEALSAITVPSSHPTTHYPTFAPTRQHTTSHYITFDDDSVANAESQLYSEAAEDAGENLPKEHVKLHSRYEAEHFITAFLRNAISSLS